MNKLTALLFVIFSISIQSQEYSIDIFFKDYNPTFNSIDELFIDLGESDLATVNDSQEDDLESNQFRTYEDLTHHEKSYLQKLSDTLAYDYTNATDKEMHFNAGYIIGSISSELCSPVLMKQTNKSSQLRFWCSFTAATLAGVAKEFYDSTGRGNVEAADAVATSLGGFQLEFRF